MQARSLTPIPQLAVGFAAIALAALAGACSGSTTTVTSPSTVPRCGVTLETTNSTLPAAGGNGQIAVTAARECPWTATAEAGWLSFVGQASGQGNGAIEFRAAPNPDPVTRRARIALNDQGADITQSAAECTFTLRESSASFPRAGGSGTVAVVPSSQLCTWSASADAEWITFTPPVSGTGSATVRFNVASTTEPPRTGTITIAGQRFSVMQSEGCGYTIAPASQSFGAAGGTGTITMSTSAGCPWTAGSNVNWITISQGSTGSGPGAITFVVSTSDGPSRTGTVVAGGQTFTVTQTAGCTFQVSPLAHTVPPAGGTGTVSVAAAAGCAWTATSDAPWLTISGGAAGSGSGVVTFTAAATNGPARTGTLTVADHRVTVTQSQGCTYTIDPSSQNVGAGGGTGTVTVTAAAGCSWTAASAADWVTITDGRTGSGNGTVRFSVAATSGPSRTATLTIAGHSFTVNQGQGCTFSLSPESANVPAAGATRSFEVRTAAGCGWTAASNAQWIAIPQGASGNGTGTVNLSVAANNGPARSGTVTAGGQTFTVNQDGSCVFGITPQQQAVDAAGGPVSVAVAGPAGCTWTASSNAQWIAITSGASGNGPGTVQLSVAANPEAARTGTATIAGQTFTVNQGSGCSFTVAPDTIAAPAAGGPAMLSVTTANNCSWTASTTGTPWVSIVRGATGTGPGSVDLAIEPNASNERAGSVLVAGRTIVVRQASGCVFTLDAQAVTVPASGGPRTISVTTTPGCSWSATSQVPWIVVAGMFPVNGPGVVQFTVEPNGTGTQRVGTILVAGQTFTVTQTM
jgi:Putative binding domain, N-terminal/Viral BACON domain